VKVIWFLPFWARVESSFANPPLKTSQPLDPVSCWVRVRVRVRVSVTLSFSVAATRMMSFVSHTIDVLIIHHTQYTVRFRYTVELLISSYCGNVHARQFVGLCKAPLNTLKCGQNGRYGTCSSEWTWGKNATGRKWLAAYYFEPGFLTPRYTW